MEYFFDTIYDWTAGFYGNNLDNYLYDTVKGYLHVGLAMVVITFVSSALFYYVLKPVRRQTAWWFGVYCICAVINFLVAFGYTMTPLVNHAIEKENEWSCLDCMGFGIANVLWAFVFYVIAALILKWWSIDKYVPFRIF